MALALYWLQSAGPLLDCLGVARAVVRASLLGRSAARRATCSGESSLDHSSPQWLQRPCTCRMGRVSAHVGQAEVQSVCAYYRIPFMVASHLLPTEHPSPGSDPTTSFTIIVSSIHSSAEFLWGMGKISFWLCICLRYARTCVLTHRQEFVRHKVVLYPPPFYQEHD